jgi:hypothetical protein
MTKEKYEMWANDNGVSNEAPIGGFNHRSSKKYAIKYLILIVSRS